MRVPMRLPRTDVNTKLCCLCEVSSYPRCLIQFACLSVMMLISDYGHEMMLFCTVVKHGFQTAEKRLNWLHLQVWAALCYGPRWATVKGGSENLCVNTWHRLQKRTKVCTLTFLPNGVLIRRAHLDQCECKVFLFSGALRYQKLLSWHLF